METGPPISSGRWAAWAADALTALRVLVAMALIPVLGTGKIAVAAVLVGLAWITDFLDGRVARASEHSTRLGAWDLGADTAVGAGIVLGFAAEGWLEPWLGVAIVVLLGGAFVLTRNEAMSMLLQATGYGLLLWRTWTAGHRGAFGWLVGVIAVIGVVNREVLVERSLPTFFRGIGAAVRGRRSA